MVHRLAGGEFCNGWQHPKGIAREKDDRRGVSGGLRLVPIINMIDWVGDAPILRLFRIEVVGDARIFDVHIFK